MDLGGEMESGKVTEYINLIIHPFTRMSLATQLMLNTISTTQQQRKNYWTQFQIESRSKLKYIWNDLNWIQANRFHQKRSWLYSCCCCFGRYFVKGISIARKLLVISADEFICPKYIDETPENVFVCSMLQRKVWQNL